MNRYILSPHEQGSDGWLLDRCGRATGSRAADMLAKTAKGEWAAKRADYKFELAIEVLTRMPQGSDYVSKEMQWGIDQEPFARMAYEEKSGNVAIESGFMYLPDVDAGCSVDGLFVEDGRRGVLETKCPKSTTHIRASRKTCSFSSAATPRPPRNWPRMKRRCFSSWPSATSW
jgi:hypothetical protein